MCLDLSFCSMPLLYPSFKFQSSRRGKYLNPIVHNNYHRWRLLCTLPWADRPNQRPPRSWLWEDDPPPRTHPYTTAAHPHLRRPSNSNTYNAHPRRPRRIILPIKHLIAAHPPPLYTNISIIMPLQEDHRSPMGGATPPSPPQLPPHLRSWSSRRCPIPMSKVSMGIWTT